MPTSKPRPIHLLPRDLRETPDEAEPSYSYEDHAFMGGLEIDVEDEFHRRLAGSTRSSIGGGSSNNNNNNNNGGGGGGSSSTNVHHHHHPSASNPNAANNNIANTSINNKNATSTKYNNNNNNNNIPSLSSTTTAASTTSSFWRTDLPSQLPPSRLPSQPVTVKERKSSGGLLGAALQLHSQGTSNTSSSMLHAEMNGNTGGKGNNNKHNNNKGTSGATPRNSLGSSKQQQHHHHETSRASSFSGGSTGNHSNSHNIKRSGSSMSSGGGTAAAAAATIATQAPNNNHIATNNNSWGRESNKKNISKQRAEARRLKLDSQLFQVDIGHVVPAAAADGSGTATTNTTTGRVSSPTQQYAMNDTDAHSHFTNGTITSRDGAESNDSNSDSGGGGTPGRNSSNGSSSLYYSNRSSSGAGGTGGGILFGKSSSLIFPTGVDPPGGGMGIFASGGGAGGAGTSGDGNGLGGSATATSTTTTSATTDSNTIKRHKINLLLDQCETVRFPFKKKLMLNSLNLSAADIPVRYLYGTNLGNTLHKLSLAGNRLSTIPPKLVVCLPVLKTLDLSQCELHQLPERWNLPQLKRLNLSHNRLTDFPEETMLEGLLELQELNMYGNKVSVLVLPHNPKLLGKLESLNLGYNDLAYIPDELDRLKSLRTLKVMNNFLEKIPMRVCEMELKTIDVSSNPVIQPPIETCERGIGSMKRYYHCLRMEALDKMTTASSGTSTTAASTATGGSGKKQKGKKIFTLSKRLGRKASDDSMSHIPQPQSNTVVSFHQDVVTNNERRTVSVNLPVTSSSASPGGGILRSRAAAFSLDTPDEVRRSKSLDSKFPTTPLATTAENKASSTITTTPTSPKSLVTATTDTATIVTPKPTAEEPATAATTPTAPDSDPIAGPDLKGLSNNIDEVTVNDTLKVIFVGMAMAGKTSMIKRLIEGEGAIIPKRDERTVGVDIYEWDPKDDHRFEHIDSRIELQDKELEEQCGDVNVKFSVWDFAGQHVYHATHELFFSPRALYVLVWDMGATNPATKPRKSDVESQKGAFSLNYSSDSDSDDDDEFTMEEEVIRADRALKRDIDDKIQFWVDCIQSSAPGAAILPVASFDDLFLNNPEEATRRCNILKERLLEHEARRIQGVEDRLKEYEDQNRANDDGALRLRKLLCSYIRPKLIFGNTPEDSVVRVSGLRYTGFAALTERIINIATGRERANMRYPIFRGHVGARIPRMRLEVREAVRRMRDRFKVVEWGYFISQLRENGLTNVEDISDALHFLTNIGELSYFGGELPDREEDELDDEWAKNSKRASMTLMGVGDDVSALSEDDELDDDTEDLAFLSADNTSTTMPTTEAGSMSTLDETLSRGLSQFVFLNPRWLVAAVACILRHDLDREIQETRRALNHGKKQVTRADSFYASANLNCPIITAEDACMLWQAKKFTKKAAERVEEYSYNLPVKPFEFLQLLLIRFGVFVPIDLGIEKAFLGGVEYTRRVSEEDEKPEEITIGQSNSILKATYFFLPSLLGPGEPAEAWTYKSTDSWKATLCHSVMFPDGVPPGLMERINASVLSSIYAIAHRQEKQTYRGVDDTNVVTYEGQLTVKEVLCWRTAFLVKVGMQSGDDKKESIVEVFCGLVDKESHLCVGSNCMHPGMRRLIVSGKGQEGNGGRKIWKGGYLIVLKAAQKVMDEYGGLEFEKHGFCPDCLAKKAVGEASCWNFTVIRSAVKNGESFMRCRYGHRIDTRLVAGPLDNLQSRQNTAGGKGSEEPIVPIQDLLRGVVVVGLWDGKSRKVIRVGSGFIADKKRGLIVTASHTLMNIWGDKNTPFGENYYGLRQGKVVIGIIPRKKGEGTGTEAVFRYFAKIVAKDPFIEEGVCHLDACVLKITTRMENDVSGSGEGCGDQPERLLLNNPLALKQEKLHQLKITDKCELDEQVRIVGYNQGGEGLLGPGVSLNRYVDFARGYVCKKFAAGEGAHEGQLRHRFKPREEIVVICPTIGGHSGGPCVNQQGEVIGILSRADPAESQRCYLVPTYEWRALLREARNSL